jgi:Sigma-70, region 4
MLAFYGGYTYLQVASMLGVPLSTVKSRIRQALTNLRDGMQHGTDPATPSLSFNVKLFWGAIRSTPWVSASWRIWPFCCQQMVDSIKCNVCRVL